MVKKQKIDRDKWYYAAKEQGYRSRAAFKLTQLNKKFDFLSGARACLDLCAAPGGWLQVAAKYMPVSSIIIGVDLLPIRPIRNVITLKEDITTQKCRHEIKKNLKGWKVDVCIHDGAPNLGQAWAQDAYGQNTLTLASVGLAVDFLREGGTFVTKVFRSADYNSLLWVFNQLFKKVTVTKPPASRGTSAEIFAVCEGFLAPKQLDPRFLDPKHVFKELDAPAEKELYFGQKRAKRNREGYDDGTQLLFRMASIAEFIDSDNPTSVLANNHRLTFDEASAVYKNDRKTSPEIQACCEDIQVLGRKEIKDLLRWRLTMIKRHKESDEEPVEEAEKPDHPLTLEEEEKQIDEELETKITRAQQKKRQKLKKERKKASKLQRRKDMKMDLVDDAFDLRDDEEDLFALANIKSKQDLEAFESKETSSLLGDSDSEDSEDSDSDEDAGDKFLYGEEKYDEALEKQLDHQYNEYMQRSKSLMKAILKKNSEAKKEQPLSLEMMDLQEKIERASATSKFDSDSEGEGEGEGEDARDLEANPLLIPEASEVINPTRRASQWFSQDLFDQVSAPDTFVKEDEEMEEDEQEEEEELASASEDENSTAVIDEDDVDTPSKRKKEVEPDFEVVPITGMDSDDDMNDYERAELLALGTLIKTGKMKLSDLIDDGFNRYAFNDNELPTWFEQEEHHHSKPMLPITKEMTREILENNRAINARPIKKVAEAKARKKLKAKRKIDKVKKRANHIALDNELSETAKARAIEKLYKQQMAKMKTKQVYVVRNKFQKGKARIGPKKQVGTKVKIVDKRMKADKRGETARKKKSKK